MKLKIIILLTPLCFDLARAQQATAATNTFSLKANPQYIEVAPGHSSYVTISSAVVSGTAESIDFDTAGMPADITLIFDLSPVTAGESTTLQIAAESYATVGATSTITIYGRAESDTETATISLRVATYLPPSEWQALALLYNATGGTAWTTNTGWDFSGSGPNGSECGWYGITCDTTPHITEIDLQNNNLTGALPDLSAFSQLTLLNVIGGNLTGQLPQSLRNLPNLTSVDVSVNDLSGDLSVLNGLSNLQYFAGDQNAFTGELPQLDSMPSLLEFSASNNELTGPMPSLAGTPLLTYVNVEANYLTGVFPSLDDLNQLQYLYISANRFTDRMPDPPNPTELFYGAVNLCPNFFAPIDNAEWDELHGSTLWYSSCDTDTIFQNGFGAPPSLQ
jgi:hypothetical protein